MACYLFLVPQQCFTCLQQSAQCLMRESHDKTAMRAGYLNLFLGSVGSSQILGVSSWSVLHKCRAKPHPDLLQSSQRMKGVGI